MSTARMHADCYSSPNNCWVGTPGTCPMRPGAETPLSSDPMPRMRCPKDDLHGSHVWLSATGAGVCPGLKLPRESCARQTAHKAHSWGSARSLRVCPGVKESAQEPKSKLTADDVVEELRKELSKVMKEGGGVAKMIVNLEKMLENYDGHRAQQDEAREKWDEYIEQKVRDEMNRLEARIGTQMAKERAIRESNERALAIAYPQTWWERMFGRG